MKSITLKIITRQLVDPMPPARGENTGLSLMEEEVAMARLIGPAPEPQEEEKLELVTQAVREVTDDGEVKISYVESELTGMNGTVTTIRYRRSEPQLVSIARAGVFSSVIVLEKKKVHSTLYDMPGASLEMKIHTLDLDNRLDAEGKLCADYVLRIGGEITMRNKLSIEVMGG